MVLGGGLLPDFCLWQSKLGTASCDLIFSIHGSAVGQNHHQRSDFPKKVAKSVDKVRRIWYNFYGILNYSIIINYTTDYGLFGVCFLFWDKKKSAAP